MITWIIWGYLAVSGVASLFVYAACVASARADRIQQHAFAARSAQDHLLSELQLDDKQSERIPASQLLLNA
ncbi:MAG: hypothetical protein R3E79_55635 [Caldilineaceae bacterium]